MYRILLIIFLASFVSCNGNKGSTSKSKEIYDQVMAIHDEVMPKMRDIRILKKKLKKVDKHEEKEDIVLSIDDLDNAHESMMDWMAQFKMPKEASEKEEIQFLNGQMISVNEMKQTLLDALDQAEITVSKYTKE